ncbi:MAG: Transcriptional regulator, MarR family, partial [uncultured Arthrobacter sp.]
DRYRANRLRSRAAQGGGEGRWGAGRRSLRDRGEPWLPHELRRPRLQPGAIPTARGARCPYGAVGGADVPMGSRRADAAGVEPRGCHRGRHDGPHAGSHGEGRPGPARTQPARSSADQHLPHGEGLGPARHARPRGDRGKSVGVPTVERGRAAPVARSAGPGDRGVGGAAPRL